MYFVLIIFLTTGIDHIEYNSMENCEAAGKAMLKIHGEETNSPDNLIANYICTQK